MNTPAGTLVHLENETAALTVDLFGGVIKDFHLKRNKINPLSFAFSKEQMPLNNRNGAPYRGHFLCLGRWGEPSAGEKKAGVPNHGEAANILWQLTANDQHRLHMQTLAKLEGLQAERTLVLDKQQPVYVVKETVQNVDSLGRLYNMVQHPTLAAPFLSNDMIVDCNASTGFDQALYQQAEKHPLQWPFARDAAQNKFDLRSPDIAYNSVFSFIVKPEATWGWITAYSPLHRLLMGYVWKRSDYPWIHLWQHWNGNNIQYRGIEFGTAGIHQPFKEILDTATRLFGEKTFAYIDAGEMVSKSYVSFMLATEADCSGVENVCMTDGFICIKLKEKPEIRFPLNPELLHELS